MICPDLDLNLNHDIFVAAEGRVVTRLLVLVAVLIVVCGGAARGSDGPFGNRLISPEQVGLPSGNKRNSEPFVTRIYMTDSPTGLAKRWRKSTALHSRSSSVATNAVPISNRESSKH